MLDDAGGAVGSGDDPAVPLHVEVLLVRQDRVAPELQHLLPRRGVVLRCDAVR